MNEIGQKLREARIEKGYTLDDLQQITKIQKRYLIAIEEGNFDALPGSFYVRAFIKQYAQTVGLDNDALLAEYQDTLPNTKPEEYVEKSVENQTRLTRETTDSKWSKWRNLLPQITIVAIVIIIIAVVYGIALSNRGKDREALNETSSSVTVSGDKPAVKKASSNKDQTAESRQQAASESRAQQASKQAATEKTKKQDLSAKMTSINGSQQTFEIKNLPAKTNQITFSAEKSAAWVSLTANGTQIWQGSVAVGAEQTAELPEGVTQFSIQTGNAPATKMKINGTDVNLNPNNEATFVRTINFTATLAK
ncbi:helix-turn-helix domain-containing protein [Latilactobacillus graminis]|nr:helix-turn-helix domain-containing protein [Latilactobacillus graminis]QFP79973.1 helix-turn-helix domain-containing protein [Latilactobacillus graminis]